MKIWIYIDGRQEGPYTLEELLDKPVNENTRVWYEGLPKWYPAGQLEAIRPLFDGSLRRAGVDEAAESRCDVESQSGAVYAGECEASPSGGVSFHPAAPSEPCPPTYLGWSIFLAICCCSPLSLGALVASIIVSTSYNGGRIDTARRASEWAAWLIMIAIALGAIPVVLMSSFF